MNAVFSYSSLYFFIIQNHTQQGHWMAIKSLGVTVWNPSFYIRLWWKLIVCGSFIRRLEVVLGGFEDERVQWSRHSTSSASTRTTCVRVSVNARFVLHSTQSVLTWVDTRLSVVSVRTRPWESNWSTTHSHLCRRPSRMEAVLPFRSQILHQARDLSI